MKNKPMYIFCRYFVALMIMFYGFAKINEAQFTVLESELDKPVREVSGFWLTWYYFGYSQFYGNFIALAQIGAGIMLLFRRTTLLGSCILFGILGNIILIDIFYGIDRSALTVAVLLEAFLVWILWQHKSELIHLFWSSQNQVVPQKSSNKSTFSSKNAVRLAVVILPFLFTYYIANFNNRRPTPLDGRWEIVEITVAPDSLQLPTHIYFERNRAFLCVFRYPDRWVTHHFEINEERRSISIWDEWLRKESLLLSGSYELDGNTLSIQGNMSNAPFQMSLHKLQ